MSEATRIHHLLTATPVDQVAARVMRNGVSFVPHVKPSAHTHSSEPLAIRYGVALADPSHDLTGKIVGKFKVVGMSAKKGMWVVQCQCGGYERRYAKAIKNPANNNDACVLCRQEMYVRKEGRRSCLTTTEVSREPFSL